MPSPDPATRLEAPSGPWRGPVPVADIDGAPFWAGLRRHELVILRCGECRRWVHPPQASCPRCLSLPPAVEYVGWSGTVHAFRFAQPGYAALFARAEEQLDAADACA